MPYIGNNHIAGDHTNNFKVLDDISSYTATFDGSAASVIDTTNNTIRVVEHRFIQGQRVTYTNGGGGNIGGLTTGTAYFIIHDSASTFKLATSASNAANSTAINLSAVGTGSSHTLNAAFDGVNTKFKITYNGGTAARFNNATQLNIAINNVLQKPNADSLSYTEGFAIEDNHKIVFKVAPTQFDIFWGSIIANTLTTFDISDHKIDTFTGNGSTTEFTLSHTPANNESLMVTINGVLQHPSNASTVRAYTLIASIIQFTSAPANGDEIQVRHLGFAGATTADVSGFYGRTGNVVLTSNDHITTGNINAGIVTATSFHGSFSPNVGGSNANFTGIVTAGVFKGGDFDGRNLNISGIATFAGDVSIGGTLTYEDVTNIDSVGIITAQKDVHVGAGVSVVGIVTAATFKGDGDFVELDVDGHTNLDNVSVAGVSTFAGDIVIPDSIVHSGDTDTKIRFPQDNNITLETSGSQRLRVDSLGRIGIHQPSPQYKLDILEPTNTRALYIKYGTSTNSTSGAQITNSSGAGNLYLGVWGPSTGAYGQVNANDAFIGSQEDWSIHSISNTGVIKFGIGASGPVEKMRITSGGDVGVGNDSPNCRLAVKDTAEHTAYNSVTPSVGDCMLQLYNNPPNETANDHSTIQFGVYGGSHNRVNTISAVAESASNRKMALTFCTDSGANRNERMRITGDGFLGLGTNNPQRLLHLLNSSGDALARITSADGNAAYLELGDVSDPDGGKIVYDSGNNLELYTASNPRLRITGSGQVLVGGFASTNANNLIHARLADGSIASNSTASVILAENSGNAWITIGSGASNYGGILFADNASSDIGQVRYDHSTDSLEFLTNGGSASNIRLRITSSGQVRIGGSGNPTYNFEVKGTGQQTILIGSENAGGAFLTLDGDSNGDGSGGDYCSIGQKTDGDMQISADNPNGDADIIFLAGNSQEKLRITSGGCTYGSNFGIGTDDRWKIRPNNTNADLAFEYATSSTLSDNNIKMVLKSSGRVGIGILNPQCLLNLVEDNNDGAISQLLKLGNNSSGAGTGAGIQLGAGYGNAGNSVLLSGFYDGTGTSFAILTCNTFNGAQTEKFRISNDGRVTIGDVDSASSSALHIRSDTGAETTLELSTKGTYNGSLPDAKISFTQQNGTEIARVKCDTNTGAANMADLTFWTNYGGLYERMRIAKTGEIKFGAASTAPVALADVEINYDNPVLLVRDTAENSSDNDAKIGFGNASAYPTAYMSHIWDGSNGSLTFHTRVGGNEYTRLLLHSTGQLDSTSTFAINTKFKTTNASGSYNVYEMGNSGASLGFIGSGAQLATGGGATDFCIRAQSGGLQLCTSGANVRAYIQSSNFKEIVFPQQNNDTYAQRVYRTTVSANANSYTKFATVSGPVYGTHIKMSTTSTIGNVVTTGDFEIKVGHSNDILIISKTLAYTNMTVKVITNGNQNFDLYLKRAGGYNTSVNSTHKIAIHPQLEDTVVFNGTINYSGQSHEHTTSYGAFKITGTGGPDGNVIAAGSVTANGSKPFKIKHPLESLSATKDLVHAAIEGPQVDLIYRGKIDLVDGTATINLDTKSRMTEGTFVLLNRDVQCFTTNETGWTNVKGSVSGNILTIIAQDNSCTDTISWMVIGERQDDSIKGTSVTDANGKLIMEPLNDENVDTSHLHEFYPT